MAKDFHAMARIMHPAQPSPYPAGSALAQAWQDIGESAVKHQASYLQASEDRRRAAIDACKQCPTAVLRLPFFRRWTVTPLSTTEAASLAQAELRRQRKMGACDTNVLIAAWEAAIIARYFRRFGQRIWTHITTARKLKAEIGEVGRNQAAAPVLFVSQADKAR